MIRVLRETGFGDRGYRGCEGVIVCGSREMRAKRRRKIVRRDYGMVVEFEEVRYGLLMMVLCDRVGRVYDVWITFGSVHEVRAFRERKKRSLWFRGLVENCVIVGR